MIGCSLSLSFHWIYSLPILVLAWHSKRKVQGFVFLLAGVIYTLFTITPVSEQSQFGHGLFTVESLSPAQSPFQRSKLLKGRFKSFETEGEKLHNVSCIIFQKKIPESGHSWYLEGKLERGIFKPTKDCPWIEASSPPSLARLRYQLKESVRKHFHKLPNKKVGHFFASMATGDIDDRLLAMEFRKLGLGHILAISGFHFALVVGVIGSLLRLFLKPKAAYLFLLFFLTLYFLYLGPAPSILRAYLMICLFVLGRLLHRRIDALNLLGMALLVELTVDPSHLQEIGFQLSFLATFGILAFYRPCEKLFQLLLPKRPFSELKQMKDLDKHGYLLSSTFRSALALNLAVHFATLPVVLFSFHCFPLLSFAYNLFLPPCLGISLLGIPFGPLNVKYTNFLLSVISGAPERLNYKIFTPYFPFEIVILIVTLIGTFGLTLSHKIGNNNGLFSWRS